MPRSPFVLGFVPIFGGPVKPLPSEGLPLARASPPVSARVRHRLNRATREDGSDGASCQVVLPRVFALVGAASPVACVAFARGLRCVGPRLALRSPCESGFAGLGPRPVNGLVSALSPCVARSQDAAGPVDLTTDPWGWDPRAPGEPPFVS